jgi:hypothetical protein
MSSDDAPTSAPLKPLGLDIGSSCSRLSIASFVLAPGAGSCKVATSVVSTANGVRYTPSVAVADPKKEGMYVVGETALELLRRSSSTPENKGQVVLGTPNSVPSSLAAATTAEFFKELQSMSCGAVGLPTGQPSDRLRAVVSLPPSLSAPSLTAAVEAGFGAGSVLACLPEAACVCVAHGLGGSGGARTAPHNWRRALVVSWGAAGLTLTPVARAGTADAFRVEASAATSLGPEVGGERIVDAVVAHCAGLFARKNSGLDVFESGKAIARLRLACEIAVRTLAKGSATSVDVDGLVDGVDLRVPLSRPRFEMLAAAALAPAKDLLKKAAAAGDYQVVLKAGAVCLMPAAAAAIEEAFPGCWHGLGSVPADEAAAVGAASHAAVLVEAGLADGPAGEAEGLAAVKGLSVGVALLAGGEVAGEVLEVLGDGAPVGCYCEGRVDAPEGGEVGVVDMKTGKVLAKIGDVGKGSVGVFLAANKEGGIMVRCGNAEGVIA